MECHIEIYLDGRWLRAATFEPQERGLAQGTEGGCRLEYEPDYALAHLEDRRYELAPEYPVNFAYYRLPHWPPFLLDLLPGRLLSSGTLVWGSCWCSSCVCGRGARRALHPPL